jgi:hypothetical protein
LSTSRGSAAHGDKPLISTEALQADISIDAMLARPLVTSEALQADISKDALLLRAKHLYEIAKLSLDEYNRPTRVIGSKGPL